MKKTRRAFSATFKAKVVMESLKERNTIQQLAEKFNLHPNQISSWKKEFIENADRVFSGDNTGVDPDLIKQNDELFRQIGQLQVENTWLKKKVL